LRRKPTKFSQKHHYIVNQFIRGDQFRVISDDGKQIGIVSRQQASDLAAEKGVDLVLISGKAVPPVVKVIDLHKFIYQEEKKAKEGRKGQKKSQIKDIAISLFIGENDFLRLVTKAKQFISEGHQVRIKLILRGRELGKKNMAFDLINKFISLLGEISVTTPPRLLNKIILAVVSKKK
jgi:translation initiation factor IF-3